MLIRLYAFDRKMVSEPMDVPENTGPNFKIVLMQQPQAIVDYGGKEFTHIPKIGAMCEFRWTGKYEIRTDRNDIKIYVLERIEQI